jgi:hypothetical protein
MAEWRLAYRLPMPGSPRVVFVTDYGLRRGQLLFGASVIVEVSSRGALVEGVSGELPGTGRRVTVRAADGEPIVSLDGIDASREDRGRAPVSRSAWVHGWIALAGSAFGFAASYLYVLRARALDDAWSMKMAWHMAAWHLLLTLTLFPASVWGQRAGIRAVQMTSLVFFAIHLGLAGANAEASAFAHEAWAIAVLNAASGAAFLSAVVFGQWAHRDMDPWRGRTAPDEGSRILAP